MGIAQPYGHGGSRLSGDQSAETVCCTYLVYIAEEEICAAEKSCSVLGKHRKTRFVVRNKLEICLQCDRGPSGLKISHMHLHVGKGFME